MEQRNNYLNKTRFLVALVVSAYFIYYTMTYTKWHFLDNVNLVIHEAGHAIFSFFGEFIHVLGGSFLQIAFPFLFSLYFYHHEDYFSASLVLFWVGQNILNVSVYASDAALMQLPLLGGDAVMHDWNYMLGTMGLLNSTSIIGFSIYAFGVITVITAIIGSLYYSQESL